MNPLLTREEIHQRLQLIFPDGTYNRNYCTRLLAASTIFTALYINAIENTKSYLGPKHVYRMTDAQSQLTSTKDRLDYSSNVLKGGKIVAGNRWYQDNTREPIRDETLREGLVAIGAVIERSDVATTSSKPRYALTLDFAQLFNPSLQGADLEKAISAWQEKTLNAGALARLKLVRRGATKNDDQILVTFPNGETQRLKPGPSSHITKAVIEVFASRFLSEPVVLFVSESGNKIVARHDEIARSIGLDIKADKDLPDIILADIATSKHPLLVFIEVVATDGPVNERRKAALEKIVNDAKFPIEHVAYVTAFSDRSAGPFKKTADSLAWGSYAWFVSEPEHIVEFHKNKESL